MEILFLHYIVSELAFTEETEDVSLIQRLIQLGADVNRSNSNGLSPLLSCLRLGNHGTFQNKVIAVAIMLLNAGADPNYQVKQKGDALEQTRGGSALHLATQHLDTKLIQLLLEKGADVNRKSSQYGTTPLHEAILSANSEAVDLLIAAGADVNVKDSSGERPLKTSYSLPFSTEDMEARLPAIREKLASAGAYE
ncbi:hypothetical protein HC928_21960 [bacterium]|nr:hypothetical protein [bacterium]